MRVYQPGSHLSEERGSEVGDWSWRRTRRRIGLLARLALPEERGRRADPAEVAAAEDHVRDRDAAPAECPLLHAPIVRRRRARRPHRVGPADDEHRSM